MVFEANADQQKTEQTEKFIFYHTNFEQELAEYFSPVTVIKLEQELFGLYKR